VSGSVDTFERVANSALSPGSRLTIRVDISTALFIPALSAPGPRVALVHSLNTSTTDCRQSVVEVSFHSPEWSFVMNNFYQACVSLLQLGPTSQGPAGVVWLVCSVALGAGASGSYTGNPFTALKNAIVIASTGSNPMAYQDGVVQMLTSAELRFASR